MFRFGLMDELVEDIQPLRQYVRNVSAKRDKRSTLYVGRSIGRSIQYGNLHRMENEGDVERLRVIKAYWEDMKAMDPEARSIFLQPIREHLNNGGVLTCYCDPKPCHGHILAWFALNT